MEKPNHSAGVEIRTIKPGGIEPIYAQGNFFLVLETNVPIQILRPGAPFAPYQQGDDEEMPPGVDFDRLEVKNTSIVDARVVIYIGYGRRRANRQAVIEPMTRVTGHTGTLAGGAHLVFDPVVTTLAGDIRRKQVIVSNKDTISPLDLRDPLGIAFLQVPAGESRVVNISEKLQLHNPGGSAIEYTVGEVFWTT